MEGEFAAIESSLWVLCALLTILFVRSMRKYSGSHSRAELMWGGGLALAAAAMAVEAIVFVGFVSSALLQVYVFCSAAIVGVLSLGATRVLRSPRIESGYTAYIAAATALVALGSFLTPLSSDMVSNGIIAGNPPLLLLVLSTLVTGPATVVLLTASVVSLRRSRKWQTLLMIAGALILGAGGTLYIASFPVALYYAEFIGIVLLFFGLISMPMANTSKIAVPGPAPSH
jgi:hypothetical protein